MAKRQGSLSLSFVLLRFALVMLGCMLLCCLLWLAVQSGLQTAGIIYHGSVSNQQVEEMLGGHPAAFVAPDEDFLAEYALFDPNGAVLETNTEGNKLDYLREFFQTVPQDVHIIRYKYEDGSTLVIHWHYRREFTDPDLRTLLPPFEYLWFFTLGGALVLCLILNTLWLRRYLASRLRLFGEVSQKVGAQELDFVVPQAGIREYDQALDAMEHMREALYRSLSSQWAAQQEREGEIAALAHDLKTPLTLIRGNAELLLEESLPEDSRKMAETIAASSQRAEGYVAGLLEACAGTEEEFQSCDLALLFEELWKNALPLAAAEEVSLKRESSLQGTASLQKEHLLRALGNLIENAIEHTPKGGNVYLNGSMTESGWQITILDEGPGFTREALIHGTERLWRGDTSRSFDGHKGLGLWIANQVIKTHSGDLALSNWTSGGMVTVKLQTTK